MEISPEMVREAIENIIFDQLDLYLEDLEGCYKAVAIPQQF